MKKNHPVKIDQEEAIYERCAGIDEDPKRPTQLTSFVGRLLMMYTKK